jgi:hypothetical protein
LNIQHFGLFCGISGMLFGIAVYWSSTLIRGTESANAFLAFIVTYFVMFALSMVTVLSYQFANYRKMRDVIKNDLSLPGAHVESYSYPQIERQFFLSLITNLLLAETILAMCIGAGFLGGDYFHPVFLIGIAIIIATTVVFTAVYYPLGRYFLEICRTKQNFLAAPPLVNNPFEMTLQTISKPVAIDYPKKRGGMFGIMLLAWIGIIGSGIYYFSWYSWDKHPIPLGICAFLFVTLFTVLLLLGKKIKNHRFAIFGNFLFYFCMSGMILALEYIEFGGIYFSEAWTRSFSQEPRNPIHYMNATALLVPVIMLPLLLYYWHKTKQEESDEDKLLREAIARFNPQTMIEDEPVAETQLFPKCWMWILGLYAAAIAVMFCVGVLVL